jgi:cell division inhibitor SepF
VLDIVGVAEIAGLLGVSRQRVHEILRTTAGFPEPAAELAAGRVWQRSDVEAWIAARERPRKGVTMAEVAGVTVISPMAFEDMQTVGDRMRDAQPVVVELRKVDVVQMRRCIDFVAGAGYIAGAQVEKISDRAYLVSPPGVSVTTQQRKAIKNHLN